MTGQVVTAQGDTRPATIAKIVPIKSNWNMLMRSDNENKPNHAHSTHSPIDQLWLTANQYFQDRQYSQASSYYNKIARQIHSAEAWLMIGACAQMENLPHKTIKACRKAVKLSPSMAEAHYNLAIALEAIQDYRQAVVHYRQALQFRPDWREAFNNLGISLRKLGDASSACQVFEEGLALHPDDSQIRYNLSTAQMDLRQYLQAAENLRKVLVGHPDNSDVIANLGYCLVRQQALHEAQELLSTAYKKHTSDPGIVGNLMFVSLQNGQVDYALSIGNQFLEQDDPSHPWVLYQKAFALALTQRFDEARDVYKHARAIDPSLDMQLRIRGSFSIRLQDQVQFPFYPEAEWAEHEYRELYDYSCWSDYDERNNHLLSIVTQKIKQGMLSPLANHSLLSIDIPDDLRLRAAKSFASAIEQFVLKYRKEIPATHAELYTRNKPLRIGYVSADFRSHPTAHLMRNLFALHDKQKVEVFGYFLNPPSDDPDYLKIKEDVDHFVDLSGLSNLEAAKRIRNDNIQVLVDLMVYIANSRPEIFALRPAPVQVNFLGYPGTSGASYMDYIISDYTVIPESMESQFTEKPIRLPNSFFLYDQWQEIGETPVSRAEAGLPKDAFVYCSFNQTYKLDPSTFRIWINILNQVPNSILWLFTGKHNQARENICKFAQTEGLDLERLIFADHLPIKHHLKRLSFADLFLDTKIYNAHTTAMDALWAGVPVLTCPGKAFASRVAASQLRSLGMEESIAKNWDDYAKMAITLGLNPGHLAKLKAKLAEQRSKAPLFQTKLSAQTLEAAYLAAWQRYIEGKVPASIDVISQQN